MLTGDATYAGASTLALYKAAIRKGIPRGASGKAARAARRIAQRRLRHIGTRLGLRAGGKAVSRLIPILGWGLLAYDATRCAYKCAQNCNVYDCIEK